MVYFRNYACRTMNNGALGISGIGASNVQDLYNEMYCISKVKMCLSYCVKLFLQVLLLFRSVISEPTR